MQRGFFFLLAFTLLVAGCGSSVPAPADDWDAMFQHSAGFGWSGGDAATTVPLPGNRILWLFGDSYLSDVQAGRRTNIELRFGNTIAIERNAKPEAAPRASDMAFDWAATNSNGWLPINQAVLEDPAMPPSGAIARMMKLPVLSWPLHGTVTGTDLVLFNAVVTPFDCVSCRPFSFKVHGSVASVIAHVDRPYGDWGFRSGEGWQTGREPEQRFVPWSRAAPALEDTQNLLWGTFVMKEPTEPTTLYVYGSHETLGARDLVIARVSQVNVGKDVLAFERWTFWDGQSWTRDADSVAGIAPTAAVEVSIVPVPETWGGGYALVESGDLSRGEVRVSVSTAPWGPFVRRYTLFLSDCPVNGFDPRAKQLTYAAKAHPELGTDEEMLVSLVIIPESSGAAPFITDARQYAPRFIRLPWEEVMSHERSSKTRCDVIQPST